MTTIKNYWIRFHVQTKPIVEFGLVTEDGDEHILTMTDEDAQCFAQALGWRAEEAHAAWEAVKALRAKRDGA